MDKINGIIFKDDTTYTEILDNTVLPLGEWHHVVMTYDYVTDGTSVLNLYVNGKKTATEITNAVGPIQVGNSTILKIDIFSVSVLVPRRISNKYRIF